MRVNLDAVNKWKALPAFETFMRQVRVDIMVGKKFGVDQEQIEATLDYFIREMKNSLISENSQK